MESSNMTPDRPGSGRLAHVPVPASPWAALPVQAAVDTLVAVIAPSPDPPRPLPAPAPAAAGAAANSDTPLAALPSLQCMCFSSSGSVATGLHGVLSITADELFTFSAELLGILVRKVAPSIAGQDSVLDALAAAAHQHGASRVVDGICALAIYASDFPSGDDRLKLCTKVNTAMRIAAGSNEDTFSPGDAALICRDVEPFTSAIKWMLREVLPRDEHVMFRGVCFELERPRVGAEFPLCSFASSSGSYYPARRFARGTLMVLMTRRGASISFASFFVEDEILLPPGIVLVVVSRASATLINVLNTVRQLVVLRDADMCPTDDELFLAARAALPLYNDFADVYQLPSVMSRVPLPQQQREQHQQQQQRTRSEAEAGSGAASGNDDDTDNNNDEQSNGNAVPLDVALDQDDGCDVIIIGDGGTGKTAAAVYAQSHLSRQDAGRRLLPIFMPLPRLNEAAVKRQGGLDAALATALGCDVETLLEAARRFNVVAILDSLDETSVKDVHWAGLLERNPAAQQCRVIMTSRPTPLATQCQSIFGSARRLQVLDLVPLPQQNVVKIYQQLLGKSLVAWHDDLVLPAPIAAFATPLLASFAARLTLLEAQPLEEESMRRDGRRHVQLSDIKILDGIETEHELLDLYLERTCKLPQQALSALCFRLLQSGFHCTLGPAKAAAGVDDLALWVPCRVEDEFDDDSDFSLVHRSLVERVVARDIVAERLSFEKGSELQGLPPVLLRGITRMVLADPTCPVDVRFSVLYHSVFVERDPSALDFAQNLPAEDLPDGSKSRLLDIVAGGLRNCGDLQRATDYAVRAVRLREEHYTQATDPVEKAWRGRNLASAHHNLGNIFVQRDDDDESLAAALQHFDRALALSEEHGDTEVDVARTRMNRAVAVSRRGDPAGALPDLQASLETFARCLGPEHHEVAFALGNLAGAYTRLGQPERAVPLLEHSLEIQSTVLHPHHVNNAHRHWCLGNAHRRLGNAPEARRHWLEAQKIFQIMNNNWAVQIIQVQFDEMKS